MAASSHTAVPARLRTTPSAHVRCRPARFVAGQRALRASERVGPHGAFDASLWTRLLGFALLCPTGAAFSPVANHLGRVVTGQVATSTSTSPVRGTCCQRARAPRRAPMTDSMTTRYMS